MRSLAVTPKNIAVSFSLSLSLPLSAARSLVKFMFPLYERAKIVHEDEDYNQISLSAQQFFFSFYTSHSPSSLMMTAKKRNKQQAIKKLHAFIASD